MALGVQLCFLLFGTCLFSFLLLLECRKLEGYAFPVFSTKECPGNQADWKNRSCAINCTESNGYMCLPNENFTDLLEFCYIFPRILVKEGLCLYLVQRFSRVNSYDCLKFTNGCPKLDYFSSETYIHPSCLEIENGCFSAEPSCKRQPLQSENSINDTTLAIVLGVSIPACLLCILVFYVIIRKFGICKRGSDIIRVDEEAQNLLCGYEQREPMDMNEDYPNKKAIFDQWKRDDTDFISTKACNTVENMIPSRNLVIVAGHSGSGKSAIIQHIALKYRERGWTVKPVQKVEDIVDENYSNRPKKQFTLCVFNDPLGKESFDEILNDSWQTYAEELKVYLTTAKLLMSCRNDIISDTRVARYLVNKSAIVDIGNEKNKLSVDEKRQILTKYTSDMNLSDNEYDRIIEVQKYFPLVCRLYSSKEEYITKGIRFFIEPLTVLKEEILGFKEKDKGKYCALALLVLFNDDLCVNDLLKNKDTETIFKHMLKLCGLQESTPPSVIGNNLDSLKKCFVKMIGDRYHFYHDLVMEVTTYVFGTDYPTEIIKYADIGFLRKRVRLGDCNEHTDPFTIYLSDSYIEKLGERLFTELFGNRFIDVVLNPCLKNNKVIETLKKIIQKHPEKLPMLLEKKKKKKKNYSTAKQQPISKLAFIGLENDLSPLFVLIVFSHTDLSLECLDTLSRMHANFKFSSLLPAVYCNGAMKLFHIISKNCDEKFLTKDWGDFSPIHIVSVFHNYEILEELIRVGVDVNSLSRIGDRWTPLQLAAGNNTQEYGNENHEEQDKARRNQTVRQLIHNGANVNLFRENGVSPLCIACQNGHAKIVKMLLTVGANINERTKDGESPLYMACQHGHDSTVQHLLRNKADINLCQKDGASPLYIACQHGHDSTVQHLLRNKADINLYQKDGASPLYIACQNGRNSTVQLLLNNRADINLCTEDGASLYYTACQNGHDSTVQLLLSNETDINLCKKVRLSPLSVACLYEHYSIVQLLLNNKADINLCMKNGAGPLYIACFAGYDSTVHLLLNNGADINLCKTNGVSSLYIACQNGHDSTVQLLLRNGANINLCKKDGASPLHIACENGRESTVQLLLSNGADVNLCKEDGASPLFIACQKGRDSTVPHLMSSGADINLCMKDGASPLYTACKNGRDSTVQLLLFFRLDINLCTTNGASPLYIACQNRHDIIVQRLLNNKADINLCTEDGASPLYIACQNGHDSTVQLLLSEGAGKGLCLKDGVSPLYVAFQRKHYKIVDVLIKNEVDTSLRCELEVNPDLKDCFNENESTVKFLLQNDNILNNMYDPDSYFSLFVLSQVERVTRMMFKN